MELPSVAYCLFSCSHTIKADESDGEHLLKAVKDGKVPIERLDDMAKR